jgi:hypothetical protein
LESSIFARELTIQVVKQSEVILYLPGQAIVHVDQSPAWILRGSVQEDRAWRRPEQVIVRGQVLVQMAHLDRRVTNVTR